MKILTIISYYHPHWTGLTVHAVRLAEALASRGHQVTVLTTRYAPDLAGVETVNGVRIVRLRPLVRFSRAMLAPLFPLAAARLIPAHDVVQMHTPLPEAILVALFCRLLRRPLLITHHGDVVMPAGLLNRAVERGAFLTLALAARLAGGVTSYSRDYARHSPLLRPVRDKLSYIYPPVDLPPPQPRVVHGWRERLGLDGKLLIGFAGRWVEEKGFDYLLRALPLIRTAYPQAHLLYAGETRIVYERFFERCRSLIDAQAEHVTFLGLIRDPQAMANFYAMCDLFVLPSRTDMMGMVQVEALLSGTPLVASDIPGARVVVQQTGFGRLAAPGDPAALARAVVETLRERRRYEPDPAVVRSVFDPARTFAAYERLLSRLAAGRSRSSRRVGRPPLEADAAPVESFEHLKQGEPGLTGVQRRLLEGMMRGEADMAYRRRALRLLEMLELRDGERVLDCGCGTGFYLLMMSRLRRLRLVGLDRERRQLDRARRDGVPASLLLGDASLLPFRAASFDKVLLTEVLEHVYDDRAALREIYRVLKPGGIMALSVPHSSYPFWWDPINRVWTSLGGAPIRSGPIVGIWTNHERLYSPAALVRRLRECGFGISAVEQSTHYTFPFAHFLLYGVGKPLVEHRLLPGSLDRGPGRAGGRGNDNGGFNPIGVGLRLLRSIDRLNDRQATARKTTFVNLLVKARKPG